MERKRQEETRAAEACTPAEFKAGRRKLGLTTGELARILGTSAQTVRKYELEPEDASTARAPNPIACRVLEWLLAGWRPPEWPADRPARRRRAAKAEAGEC